MGYGGNLRQIIGARLAALRAAKGFTQKQLAEILGVSGTFVNRIESGAKAVPDGQMETLLDALGASVDDLLQSEKVETTPEEEALREIAQVFYCAGEDEARLGQGLLNCFLKGAPGERVMLLDALQDVLAARSIRSIAEMQLIAAIKNYIRANTKDKNAGAVEENHA
ncbi:helix-turn-helix domain-containing protein [Citrifermentans bremense]|uniref:helix-turn-helix domain-containing protein n=1 Tax=Citrifermentans bremense TaxID=60035 RepID=UPI000685B174|nr:helix-turn-helix transcriptional regulator [Citrifermentans bremense]